MALPIEKLNNQQAFLALLQAGLWDKDARLFNTENIDFSVLQKMAEEQSVVGLAAAGIDKLRTKHSNVGIPQRWALQYVGSALQIEQRNKAMNDFLEGLFQKMQKAGVYAILVKGQGVAQCYERPLWRTSGDVDLFLSEDNYEKAKNLLKPLATTVEQEAAFKKHLGLTLDGWLVELHGSLRNGLSARMDNTLDDIQKETFYEGRVRTCKIGNTQVFMLGIENDITYVFSHILDHFYKGGIGLRQICDWCRLLWKHKDSMNHDILEHRIRQMGVMTEWKAFGAFGVDWLGMPAEAMPFYSEDARWSKKAVRIKDFVMEVGNFGHNRDMSYLSCKTFIVKKALSFKQRACDLFRHAKIFPVDSAKFFWGITVTGLKAVVAGQNSGE